MIYNELVNQLPYMCVPSCILTVLKRRGLAKDYSQESIAGYLDFHNSDSTKDLYPQFPYDSDKAKWGCNVTSLNTQLFEPLDLSLKEDYRSYSNADKEIDYWGDEWSNYIKGVLKGDVDVIVSFDHAVIINNPDKVYKHVSLVESIDEEGIHLLTPFDNKDTYREIVSIETFIKAMKSINGGLWIIRNK